VSGGVFRIRPGATKRVLIILLYVCVTVALVLVAPRTAVAGPTLSPELSESLLKLINEERSLAGLPALILREDLSKAAEEHAVDMIEAGYFGHMSPTRGTLANRLRAADIRFSKAAENLAGCTSPELAHRLLMESASHRANVLSERFTHLGVAVVKGGRYGMMIVEVFICEPEDPANEEKAPSPSDVVGDDVPDVGGLEPTPPSGNSG
jgi:uncharacterized protein YkwD